MDDKLNRLTVKKQQLDKLKSLTPELENQLEDWLKVELTYSSNAIEGNTLTRIETAEVIEKGIDAVTHGKPLKDSLEAINHARALDFIKQLAKKIKGHQFITEEHLMAVHKIIFDNIDGKWGGKYRQTDVFIKGVDVELPGPRQVPYLMREFIRWLQGEQDEHPVMVAALAHYKFVSIHPFLDGNGRTGRLLMNFILILNGYPMAVIRNEERIRYLDALRTAQTKQDLQPFLALIENAVERSLDYYLNAAEGRSALSPFKDAGKSQEGKFLRIGCLADLTGETVATLRFWTTGGLLQVGERTPGGYQLFDSSQVERVKKIRKLQKEKRLTIAEIKKLLTLDYLKTGNPK